MEPPTAGELVLKAVLNDELYIITHGEWKAAAERRHMPLLAAMPDKLDPALLAMLKGRQ